MESLLGQKFGNCLLEEEIAGGEPVATYRAHHEGLDRQRIVALCGGPDCPEDDPVRLRFREVGERASQIQHPTFAHVTDFGQEHGYDFFVREDVEGQTLAEIVSESGPFEPMRAISTVAKAGEGVHDAFRAGAADATVSAGAVVLSVEDEIRLTGLFNREEQPPRPWERSYRAAPDALPGERDHNRALGAMLYHLITGKARERHKWSAVVRRSVEMDFALRGYPAGLKEVLIRLMTGEEEAYPGIAEAISALQLLQETGLQLPEAPAPAPKAAPEPPPDPPPPAPGPASAVPQEPEEQPQEAAREEAAAPAQEPPLAAESEGSGWIFAGALLCLIAAAYAVFLFRDVYLSSEPPAPRPGPTTTQEGAPKPVSVALQYAELISRSNDLVAAARFGEALKLLEDFASKHTGTEWARFVQTNSQSIRDTAAARFDQVKKEVLQHQSRDERADAEALLDRVIQDYGIPEFVEAAKEEKRKLSGGGE